MSDTQTNAVVPTPQVEESKTTTTVTSETKPSGSGMKMVIIIGIVIVCLCTICSIAGWFIYQSTLNASKGILNTISDQVQDEINGIQFNDNDSTDSGSSNNSEDSDSTKDEDTSSDDSYSFNGKLDSKFPSDVAIPSGAQIGFSFSSTGADEESYVSASFTSTKKVSELVSFYRDSLESEGWTIISEQSFLGTSLTAEKSGREVTVVLLGDETSDTTGSIIVTGI